MPTKAQLEDPMTLMTINEVAEQARLHPLTIRRLIDENKGPMPTHISGRIFVRPEFLDVARLVNGFYAAGAPLRPSCCMMAARLTIGLLLGTALFPAEVRAAGPSGVLSGYGNFAGFENLGQITLDTPGGGCPPTTVDYSANRDELTITSDCPGTNTLAIRNSNSTGFAAATIGGKDYDYRSSGVFEHGSFVYGPAIPLNGQNGADQIEFSRYTTTNNPLIPSIPAEIIQTGGVFTVPPRPAVLSITKGSPTATVISGTIPAAADGEIITSRENLGYIGSGTTIASGGGTSTITLSNNAEQTMAYLQVEFGPTTYCQSTRMYFQELGNISFYTYGTGCNGSLGAAFMTLDTDNGRVGINQAKPAVPLDVVGPAAVGVYGVTRATYGDTAVGLNISVTPGGTGNTARALSIFGIGDNVLLGEYLATPSRFDLFDSNGFNKNYTAPFDFASFRLDGTGQTQFLASPIGAAIVARPVRVSDCGTIINDTGAAAHTLTVPTGLPLGCRIDVIQAGGASSNPTTIGLITFAAGSGETLEQAGSGTLTHTTTGRYARAQLIINSATTFLLTGQVQ